MDTTLETVPIPIAATPSVQGGVACVANTRIPVFVLVNWKKLGWSDSEILDAYPGLGQVELDAVWSYYSGHQSEIDAAIDANERWIRE